MWNTLLVILNVDILSLPLTVKKKSLKSIKETISAVEKTKVCDTIRL